ncbi:MAG: hypothetical protein V3U14_12990 [candidate division NC10 bacterium]
MSDPTLDWEPAFLAERERTDELVSCLARALADELAEWHHINDDLPEWCQRVFGKDYDQLPWGLIHDDSGDHWTWEIPDAAVPGDKTP